MRNKCVNQQLLTLLIMCCAIYSNAQPLCSESRKGLGAVPQMLGDTGESNIHCSDTTNALLWWQDPFEGTIPMRPLFQPDSFFNDSAVIKPLNKTLKLYTICGLACHNGAYPPLLDNAPRKLIMHTDVVPDATKLQHGKGALWCLNCHHNTQRKSLVDNFGNEIPMNAAPKLCGNCHGQVYSDWKKNIHGKTIGEWQSDGKKRWFACSECHNPHDVVNGVQASGYAGISAEAPPSNK